MIRKFQQKKKNRFLLLHIRINGNIQSCSVEVRNSDLLEIQIKMN